MAITPKNTSPRARKCEHCAGGMIGSRTILEKELPQEAAAFQKVIEKWNEETKRRAIPHPGWFIRFNFCPKCGHKIGS